MTSTQALSPIHASPYTAVAADVKPLLTASEAAELLDVTTRTLRTYINQGRIKKAKNPTRRVYIDRSSVIRFLEGAI